MGFLTNGPPKPERQFGSLASQEKLLPIDQDPELTCKQGACVAGHPLHCCHFSITRRKHVNGIVLRYFECVDCKQRSRSLTMSRD